MTDYRWLIYALISALAASLVAIFGKVGLSGDNGIDSTVATTIRSLVMTGFLVGILVISGLSTKVLNVRGWPLFWIAASGIAGAVSWLFYFKAIQIGSISKIAPIDKLSMPLAVILAVIILNEKYSKVNWLGLLLIVIGAFLAAVS
jgi:transporter family protein